MAISKEEMTEGVTVGKIYVTAFLDFKTFKKFSEASLGKLRYGLQICQII